MKAQRFFTEAALLFLVAAFAFNPPAVRAADFSFGPGELVLDPADWQNAGNDPDWSIKPPFIIRRENDRESAFGFRRPIPAFFEIAFELTADSIGRSNAKGIKIRAADASFSVAIDDDYPLGIFDVSTQKYRAIDFNLRIRTRHPYRFCVRAAPGTLSATVDTKTVSTRWTAAPPFTFSFFAQRSGFRVKSIKIAEIKK
ncbi:MAG: hypothetical protein FJ388_10700 [Verrucomicrobia bacterium]|nr:hypothetical protein [Verrucomicrobiota bacterium]